MFGMVPGTLKLENLGFLVGKLSDYSMSGSGYPDPPVLAGWVHPYLLESCILSNFFRLEVLTSLLVLSLLTLRSEGLLPGTIHTSVYLGQNPPSPCPGRE